MHVAPPWLAPTHNNSAAPTRECRKQRLMTDALQCRIASSTHRAQFGRSLRCALALEDTDIVRQFPSRIGCAREPQSDYLSRVSAGRLGPAARAVHRASQAPSAVAPRNTVHSSAVRAPTDAGSGV